MLHAWFAAFSLAATTALAASGCGSSKPSPTSSAASATTATTTPSSVPTTPVTLATGRPLTRAQLIARGDAICASAITKLTATTVRSTPEFARALPQAAIYLGAEAEGLSRLVPPASMTHDWTLIVNDIHFASQYVSRSAQYFKEKLERSAGQLYAKANLLNTQSKAIARRNGFKGCSRVR